MHDKQSTMTICSTSLVESLLREVSYLCIGSCMQGDWRVVRPTAGSGVCARRYEYNLFESSSCSVFTGPSDAVLRAHLLNAGQLGMYVCVTL